MFQASGKWNWTYQHYLDPDYKGTTGQSENSYFQQEYYLSTAVLFRALDCLKAADVETLGDLVQFNKTDLLKFRNFGKKSLTELDDLLESLNLSFGTDISKYKLDKE